MHLIDETWSGLQGIQARIYCDHRQQWFRGDHPPQPVAADPTKATCTACIDAYEARPQLITTKDLAEAIKLVLQVCAKKENNSQAVLDLKTFVEGLARPRHILR